MKPHRLTILIALPLLLAVCLLGTLRYVTPSDSPTGKLVKIVCKDPGFQLKAPFSPQVQSSDAKGALFMFHRVSSGFAAEPDYLVKLVISRMPKEQLDIRMQNTIKYGADDFNKWLATNHPSLDLKKDQTYWHLRKDIPVSDGNVLSIKGRVRIEGATDEHLREATQIIESITPLR